MSCLKCILKRFDGSCCSHQKVLIFDAGSHVKTPNHRFSLLSAHWSPEGKGQSLTSQAGRLWSILWVNLSEASSCMESDYISLRLFLLSSLNDFCLFVTVLLVSSFFGLNFCPTFSVRVSASFYNSGFEKLTFYSEGVQSFLCEFFFF